MNPPRPIPVRPGRLTAAVAGLAATAGGLAAAEIVAAVSASMRSPILDVGDRIIEITPVSIERRAIAWLGTADKPALLIGTAVILAVIGAVLGVTAIRGRRGIAAAGAAAVGLVGVWASQTSARPAPWWALLPSVVGTAVAIAILGFLSRGPRPAPTADLDEPEPAVGTSRRAMLLASAATMVSAGLAFVAARRFGVRTDVTEQRAALRLPEPATPKAAAPASVSVSGASPFFTPNEDFYRIDTALSVPQVSVEDWSLEIRGMVDRPMRLSFADLLDRPLIESDITMTCVSNEVGGNLIGTARWLGVRLDDLLAEAGIDPSADQIVGRSTDGWTSGFPTSVLDGRDALVAIGMNGEPLPVEHGYPARLIVPGLYGYVSATKWLREIELTTFDRFDSYWVERGWSPGGTIRLQSRIDTPRGLARIPAGTTAVAGVAWAQRRGIEGVEIQVDDGDWSPADLAGELNVDTWRQWSYRWDATPGRHTIRVRAIESGTSAIQTPERSEPFPSGATGQHQIVVLVE